MGKGDRSKQVFSSAKAAEALQASRSGGGFGGFSGSAPTAPGGFAFGAKYVGQVAAAVPKAGGASGSGSSSADTSAVRAAAIIPADLDGELSQQLQKLNKRDATTKLKALQALKALAREKPAADLQAALPSWAYLYSRLVMDTNRAVRAEASHVSAALAAAVGRGIAPLLKSFLPSWWLAQHDVNKEAAAAARAAFAAAFPAAAKQRDAVLFCRAEVLQLLSDNLASTPQTLGDSKKESVEELQDRHESVLAATCTALTALLELALGDKAAGSAGGEADQTAAAAAAAGAAPSSAEQEVLDGIAALLQQPTFCKSLVQSKAAPVRRAAYLLVAAAAERRPQLLAPSVAAAAPAVLGALSDKEASTHEALWGMLLAYARAFPDSWRHVNMQKAFLPRLWAFLRHACYGSASSSFPALLPLVSLLPEATLGPRPAFFVSLLDATWQGLLSLSGLGPSGKQDRREAAGAFQDCLLYALLRADHLAAVGGEVTAGTAGAAGAEAAAEAAAAGRQFCSELLHEVMGVTLVPAALSSASSQPEAVEAEAILTGLVGKLGQPSASSNSRRRLDQLLQAVGSQLAAAVQAALGTGQLQAADGSSSTSGATSGTSSSSGSSEVFDRTAALVAALEQAAGPGSNAALGAAVAHPLVALLLPEVRSGTAPPSASSLLAALLKSFPQHSAADATGSMPTAPAPTPEQVGAATAAAPAAAGAAAAVSADAADEFAALRLHQSASFTIDSILRRLTEEQQAEAAAASCDLLLSCLPQVHHPARKLGEMLQQLVQQQQAAAAVMLLEHLVSGRHADLATAVARSADLDTTAAAALGSGDSWLQASDPHTPRLLVLLLAGGGGGGGSLLSPTAQTATLARLLEQLQVAYALAAESGSGSGASDAAPPPAPVLQVLQGALFAPALVASGSSEVLSLRLQLLAATFSLLLREGAAEAEEAEAAAAGGSSEEHEPSTFVDESEEESVEVELQPGALLVALQRLWQQQAGMAALLGAAPAGQQSGFLSAAQQMVQGTLEVRPSIAAATATAGAVRLLLVALEGSNLGQQLLQGLVQGRQPSGGADAAASGSGSSSSAAASSSSSSGYSAPQAIFLAAVGEAAGFDCLLPASSPSAAGAAVELLAALQAESAAAASNSQRRLLHYLAGPSGGTLLQPALQAAAAAAAASPSHAAVLRALLRAAIGAGSAGTAAAAEFFAAAAAAAGSEQQQQQQQRLSPAVLAEVLPIVTTAFRSSIELLQQSGLADLAQRLCQQCTAGAPAAVAAAGEAQQAALQLLHAAAACFLCSTGADAAAQLPSPAAATAAAGGQQEPSGAPRFAKGDAVWYCQQDGTWAEAEIAMIDVTVQPPSFSVQISAGAALRETEAGRLRPRAPDSPQPPSAAAQQTAAAAAAAVAAEQRAAAGAAMPPVGSCTAQEQAALLQLLQHQVRGVRAAAAATRAAGGTPQTAPAVSAAIAQLMHSAAAFCSQQLSHQHWDILLEQLKDAFAQCSASLAAAAARVAAAVCSSAAEIAVGADMQSPAVALQFFRRLKLKGVLDRSEKARGEAAKVAASLAAELAALDSQLLPLLLPALQAYTRAAAAAGSSRTLGERDWQNAEAAACGDMLQLFVAAGCIVAAAGVSGELSAGALSDWMSVRVGQQGAAWQLLSQHVDTTLRGADRAFLLAAVDRANGGMEATGVDALGSLLALSLSGIPPPPMAAAAFAAVLQHPELTSSLTSAESVDEDQLEEDQRAGAGADSGDAAALLEQVGVRPELAAAVAGGPAPSGGDASGFLTGWALLLAHLLAAPADSHGRRLLAQALKDGHTLVPSLLDSLVPLLPLEGATSASSRRESSGSGAAASRGVVAAAAAAAGGAPAAGGTGFASQVAAVGPFAGSSGSSADPEQPPAALERQRQRFAVLLYAAVLQALPASARLWFADLRDRGTAAAMERYTSAGVSGQLLAAELAAVTAAAAGFGKFDKFTVRANPTSREVIAVMEVEDGHMLELAVRLPASMPLRPPELECRRKVGVSEGRLRKWILSISAFLRMQNGSVAEAISLWKRNVDKEFEGQEECLICYSIIQPTSGQLPRLGCRTCRKRFHGGCLYKWFKSSGKSNCPHCQSPW